MARWPDDPMVGGRRRPGDRKLDAWIEEPGACLSDGVLKVYAGGKKEPTREETTRERSWQVKSRMKDHGSRSPYKQLECHLPLKQASAFRAMCPWMLRERVGKKERFRCRVHQRLRTLRRFVEVASRSAGVSKLGRRWPAFARSN